MMMVVFSSVYMNLGYQMFLTVVFYTVILLMMMVFSSVYMNLGYQMFLTVVFWGRQRHVPDETSCSKNPHGSQLWVPTSLKVGLWDTCLPYE